MAAIRNLDLLIIKNKMKHSNRQEVNKRVKHQIFCHVPHYGYHRKGVADKNSARTVSTKMVMELDD